MNRIKVASELLKIAKELVTQGGQNIEDTHKHLKVNKKDQDDLNEAVFTYMDSLRGNPDIDTVAKSLEPRSSDHKKAMNIIKESIGLYDSNVGRDPKYKDYVEAKYLKNAVFRGTKGMGSADKIRLYLALNPILDDLDGAMGKFKRRLGVHDAGDVSEAKRTIMKTLI